jgi:hypothetical protein
MGYFERTPFVPLERIKYLYGSLQFEGCMEGDGKLYWEPLETIAAYNQLIDREKGPEIQAIAPEIQVIAPEIQVIAPEIQAIAPEMQDIAVEMQDFSSEIQVIIPEKQAAAPETQAIVPISADNPLSAAVHQAIDMLISSQYCPFHPERFQACMQYHEILDDAEGSVIRICKDLYDAARNGETSLERHQVLVEVMTI